MKLLKDEVIVELLDAPQHGFVIRRADGTVWECEGNMPHGYWVGDYFDAFGRYRGPDSEGVEPTWRQRAGA